MNRLIVFMFVLQQAIAQAQEQKKVVLFVCEHGAARSAIASAYFNKLAAERGLPYASVFRGVKTDSALTPAAIKGLNMDGFDPSAWKPAPVTAADVGISTQVVTFDCALNFPISVSHEKWDGVPPVSEDYEVARDQILRKVEKLVTELEKKK